jgi:tetratricopeptide (TPR) repeat protein
VVSEFALQTPFAVELLAFRHLFGAQLVSEVIAEILREANHLRFERPQDALRLYTETAELCRRDGLRRELIQALKGQGQIERDLGRTPESLTHYENAAALCREMGDPLLLAHTLRHVADIQQDTGHSDLALPLYEEALTIYRSREDTNPLDLANAIRPLAGLRENMRDFAAAKNLWQEAFALYNGCGVAAGAAESLRRLTRLQSLDI